MNLTYNFVRIVIMSVLLAIFMIILKPFLENFYNLQFGIQDNIIFFSGIVLLSHVLTWIFMRHKVMV